MEEKHVDGLVRKTYHGPRNARASRFSVRRRELDIKGL